MLRSDPRSGLGLLHPSGRTIVGGGEGGWMLVLVEMARQEGVAAILATVAELESSIQVMVKRIDVVTHAGWPPRFSCRGDPQTNNQHFETGWQCQSRNE